MNEDNEVAVSKARAALAEIVNQVAIHGKTIYLTNYGRRVVAIVPVPSINNEESK